MIIKFEKIAGNLRGIDLTGVPLTDDPVYVKLPDYIPCILRYIRLGHVEIHSDSNLCNWDVSNGLIVSGLFTGREVPDGLECWTDFKQLQMQNTFEGSTFRDDGETPDITGWNVESALNMFKMFSESNFNQDISGWNIQAVDVNHFLAYTNYQHDLSSMVLPNVYFLEAFRRGDSPNDLFAPGSTMPKAHYPKTAIEAGVAEAPLVLKMDGTISASPFGFLYVQIKDPSNTVVAQGVNHPIWYELASEASISGETVYPGDTVEVYGNPRPSFYFAPVTFDDVTEVVSWGTKVTNNAFRFRNGYGPITVPSTAPLGSDLSSLFGDSEVSNHIESWDMTHVTSMDNFLTKDSGQDLSGWSVPNINQAPVGWPFPPERSPQWGV